MPAKGPFGKILYVDLSTGEHHAEPVPEEIVRTYIGGFGLANKLAYENIAPGTEPLSAANVIVFGTGLLGGTVAPSTSKTVATTKFPVTRAIGTDVGGTGGDVMKFAGLSHVVVKGRAEYPVFLKIFDDDVELCDARGLWGKDIWETTDLLKERYGNDASVIAIGPAGERLAGISFAYVNKMGHLGQGGLGAVMGYKNLKAVLIKGTRTVEVAHPAEFMKIAQGVTDALLNLSYRNDYLKLGPGIATWGPGSTSKPYSEADIAADPYGIAAYLDIWRGTQACPTCPIGCKFLMEIKEGEKSGQLAAVTGAGTGWEEFNVGNIHRTLELRDISNRMGIDDSWATSVIGLAVQLFEDGVLTLEDTDGQRLGWNYETARTMLLKIVQREGLGNVIADGYSEAIKRIGMGAEKYLGLAHKGHEPSDPRSRHFQPMTISQLVTPRGTGVIGGLGPGFMPNHPPQTFRRYLGRLGLDTETIGRIVSEDNVNMARLNRHTEDLYSAYTNLGICFRQPVSQCYTLDIAAQLYTAATGWEMTAGELARSGERAWTILKAANMRDGVIREDDGFPEAWFGTLEKGGKSFPLVDYYGNPINKEAAGKLLDDYYEERGWDVAKGAPTRQKLEGLDLGWVADDLERQGAL